MRFSQRMITLVVACILISTFLFGCNKGDTSAEKTKTEKVEILPSQTVASNENLSIKWDSEKNCVLMEQKSTGKIWSTIPYDYYPSEETHEDMNSPIYIQYVDNISMVSITEKGFTDCLQKGRVSSRQIKNGIEVTYYFDGCGISVPVQYYLRDEALVVSVDFQKVVEGEKKLLSVSLAPFLCSAMNTNEDSYLVVPSGSGGLMYVDERAEGVRTWSGEIYGDDPARLVPECLMEDEAVRLPFFGVRDGENALLAIVEEGDESAYLTANAGDPATGHSNAYVSFYARGFDISESQTAWAMNDIYRTEETISTEHATVAFYPLAGQMANYTGMAQSYQAYLKEKGTLTAQIEEQSYALYVVGGAQLKELVAGVPIEKTRALTTFKEVQKILSELKKQTNETPAVQLKGFGEKGLDPGKVAGGFRFASVFGSDKERLNLESYCSENQIPLFTDYDLVYFKSDGEGVSTLLDAAKSASSRKIKIYYKDKALWHYDEDEKGYFLVGRGNLQSLVDKLKKVVNKNHISSVCLSTLGQVAYSDYSDTLYSGRGNTIIDVQNALSQLRESEILVATQSANAYAAAVSDSIFEVSVTNGEYIALDVRVPLYQMVFKGYVPLYSTAVNATENYDQSVMLAVSSGTSLGFSIVEEYDMAFSVTPYTTLHASAYEGNKEKMFEVILECADYYKAIQGQTIIDYTFISNTVTKTKFSNGVVVYANHSDDTAESPLGQLKAYGFSYTTEGN